MALDFPASPATNQTYSGPGGVVWVWDGAKWVSGTGSTVYAPVTSPVFLGNPTAPNPPAGDADTSVATTQFVAAAVAPAFNGVGRNLLHNPLFNVAQRGAGPFTVNGYTADRWAVVLSGADTISLTVQAASDAERTVIGDEAVQYKPQIAFTGSASGYTFLYQSAEKVQRLSGKVITLSFWAATNTAGNKVGINYEQQFGTGGSPSTAVSGAAGQAVTLATTWARYSVNITLPSAVGKTLGSNGNDCTRIEFWLSAGTAIAARAGIGQQTGITYLWGVQLEIGSVATPLEKPDPRYDLSNCQRFYQAGGNYGTAVYAASPGAFSTFVYFPSVMRAIPTIVPTISGTDTNVAVAFAPDANTTSGFRASFQNTAVGQMTALRTWTASADL